MQNPLNQRLMLDFVNEGNRRLAMYEPFNRSDEVAADLYGLKLYCALRLDPLYYDDFLERVRRDYGDKGSETHPPPSERISQIDQARRQLPASTANYRALDRERFGRVRRTIAEELLTRAEKKELVVYEVAMAEFLKQQKTVPPIAACGPMDTDPDAVAARFVSGIRRAMGE